MSAGSAGRRQDFWTVSVRVEPCFAHGRLVFEAVVRGLLDSAHDDGILTKFTDDISGGCVIVVCGGFCFFGK